jgi:hypothetical protein
MADDDHDSTQRARRSREDARSRRSSARAVGRVRRRRLATFIVVAIFFAFYFCVYLPRG